MHRYRFASATYIRDSGGDGSRLYGGRWPLPAYPVVYPSEHPALAAWEFLVHFGLLMDAAPLDQRLVRS